VSYWAHTFMPDEWVRREAARYDRAAPEDAREYFAWLAHIEELSASDEDRWRWEFNLLSAEEVAEFEEWLHGDGACGLDNINDTNNIKE